MKVRSSLPNFAFLLSLFLATLATACGNSSEVSLVHGTPDSSSGRLAQALAQLDQRAEDLWTQSGVPGMAVAVVHGDRIVYAKGFGTRQVGQPETVDPDTVFALASLPEPPEPVPAPPPVDEPCDGNCPLPVEKSSEDDPHPLAKSNESPNGTTNALPRLI